MKPKKKGSRVTPKRCQTRSQFHKEHLGCLYTSSRKVADGPVVVLCSWCGKRKK